MFDWPRIEETYVSGDMSLDELAQSVGCNRSTIFRKSAQLGWAKKRELRVMEEDAFQKEQLADEAAGGEVSEENIERISKAVSAGERIVAHIMRSLDKLDEQNKEVAAKDARFYAEAIAKIAQLIALVDKIPSYAEKSKAQIERARLALDLSKAQSDTEASEITVSFEPFKAETNADGGDGEEKNEG